MSVCVAWVLVSRFPCGSFKVLVWSCSVPPELPFPGPFPGPPFPWTPFSWTAQNFALFFPLPPKNSFFSSLSGCLLVEFWWCFEAPGPSNVHVWALGLSCETPAASVGQKSRELQTRTFEGPGLPKHHQNSTRRHPERGRKERILRRDRGKKSAKFSAPPPFGPPPFGPHPSNPHPSNPHPSNPRQLKHKKT